MMSPNLPLRKFHHTVHLSVPCTRHAASPDGPACSPFLLENAPLLLLLTRPHQGRTPRAHHTQHMQAVPGDP